MGLGNRNAKAQHERGLAAQATSNEDWWEFKPGQRVMTTDGFPGVVAQVFDGPFSGNEDYEVKLDNGMGGGTYTASQLTSLRQDTASVEHTAADDYPELQTILVDRPDPAISTTASKIAEQFCQHCGDSAHHSNDHVNSAIDHYDEEMDMPGSLPVGPDHHPYAPVHLNNTPGNRAHTEMNAEDKVRNGGSHHEDFGGSQPIGAEHWRGVTDSVRDIPGASNRMKPMLSAKELQHLTPDEIRTNHELPSDHPDKVKTYPITNSQGFIQSHHFRCNTCAENEGHSNPQREYSSFACESPKHGTYPDRQSTSDEGYSEYHQFSHDPQVAGWFDHKDNVMCKDCAANKSQSAPPSHLHDWSAITHSQVDPDDECHNCGKSLIHDSMNRDAAAHPQGTQPCNEGAEADVDEHGHLTWGGHSPAGGKFDSDSYSMFGVPKASSWEGEDDGEQHDYPEPDPSECDRGHTEHGHTYVGWSGLNPRSRSWEPCSDHSPADGSYGPLRGSECGHADHDFVHMGHEGGATWAGYSHRSGQWSPCTQTTPRDFNMHLNHNDDPHEFDTPESDEDRHGRNYDHPDPFAPQTLPKKKSPQDFADHIDRVIRGEALKVNMDPDKAACWNCKETSGKITPRSTDTSDPCPECNGHIIMHRTDRTKGDSVEKAANLYSIMTEAAKDDDFRFHVQASWSDVKEKARRLQSEGRVSIAVASDGLINGVVKGDHHIYETEIQRLPGMKTVAAWNCFLPDAPVTMADGSIKPISQIRVEDLVLTHKGNARKVVRSEPKPYNGNITHIKFAGDNRTFTSTSDHEIWAKNPEGKLCWEKAGNISEGWFLTRTHRVEEVPCVVSVAHPERRPVTSVSGVRGVGRHGELWNFKVTEGGRGGKVTTVYTKTFEEAKDLSDSYYAEHSFASLKITPDLAEIIGWYIAEGHSRKDSYEIGFTLCDDEWDVANRLSNICQQNFGKTGSIRQVGDHKILFRISDWKLHGLLVSLVGEGARTKSLDESLMILPLDLQRIMMDAWVAGDGDKSGKRVTLSTVSPHLANQAREILYRLNETPNLRFQATNPGGLSTTQNAGSIYIIRWTENKVLKSSRHYIDYETSFARVDSVSHESYSGEVWDIEVEGDHSFRAFDVNVHNCGCKWAAYAWGRSAPYARFEGRMCSHALGMHYEANIRGLLGSIWEDSSRPGWLKPWSPVTVQYVRKTVLPDGNTKPGTDKNRNRRAVPPGNMHRTFAAFEWPTTPEGWCQHHRMLDQKHDTHPDSPLHHDHSCPVHRDQHEHPQLVEPHEHPPMYDDVDDSDRHGRDYDVEDPFTPKKLPKPQDTLNNIDRVLKGAIREAISQGDDPTEIALFLHTVGVKSPGLWIQGAMQTHGSFTYNGDVHCNQCAKDRFGDPNARKWDYMGPNRPEQGFGPMEETGELDLHGAHCGTCNRHIADGHSHSPDQCSYPEGQCPTNYSDHSAGEGGHCDDRGFSEPHAQTDKKTYVNYDPMEHNESPHGTSNTVVNPSEVGSLHKLPSEMYARHPKHHDRAYLSALASGGDPGGSTGDEMTDEDENRPSEGGMSLRGDGMPFDAMVHFQESRCNNCNKKIYDSSGNGDWVHKNPDYSGFHEARPHHEQSDDPDEYIVRVHAVQNDEFLWEPMEKTAGPLALVPELLAGGEAAGAAAGAGEAAGAAEGAGAAGEAGAGPSPLDRLMKNLPNGKGQDNNQQKPTNGQNGDTSSPMDLDPNSQITPPSDNQNLQSASIYVQHPDPALPYTEGDDDQEDGASQFGKDLGPMGGDDARTASLNVEALQAGLGWLNGPQNRSGGQDGASDIAAQARAFLQKSALKDFSPAEQLALINEGEGVTASNLDRLKIEGTHYEFLEAALAKEEQEDDLWD